MRRMHAAQTSAGKVPAGCVSLSMNRVLLLMILWLLFGFLHVVRDRGLRLFGRRLGR